MDELEKEPHRNAFFSSFFFSLKGSFIFDCVDGFTWSVFQMGISRFLLLRPFSLKMELRSCIGWLRKKDIWEGVLI